MKSISDRKIISADPKKLYSTKEDDKKKFDEMFNK